MAITLSVALVTRNRPDSLVKTLTSLRAQSVQPFEVLVCDDSDPEQAAATRTVAEQFDCRYVAGPRRGLYANRNAAALACLGSHIRTMDDDHTFAEDHFAQCLAAVRSDPEAIWTTGELGFLDGQLYHRCERALQLHPAGVGIHVHDPDDNWAIADGSTIYPRSIFDAGHRFIEDFRYGSSYLEFGAYLYRRGFRSRCIEGAYVLHHFDSATLTRLATPEGIRSQLFCIFVYNLHFRPNRLRALRHLAGCLRNTAAPARWLGELASIRRMADQRWKPLPL